MSNNIKIVLCSLAITLLICAVYAASLFRYGAEGIAYGSPADPGGPVRMEPGDHLQLMYHFWLLSDSLWGETEFFRNPYEFNRGRAHDDPRLQGAYYAPFGPVFALLHPLFGRAAAWNLTGFMSFWLGYLATFLLLRRYFRSFWISCLGALPALVLPYRWVTFLGGSPTGFAMMWPPVMMLGIDIAVRDKRLSGAWLAGAALLFAKWGDTHIFFFGFLAIPFWCLVSFFKSFNEYERDGGSGFAFSRAIRQLCALWPLALCMGIAMMMGLLVARSIEGSVMEAGRDFREILLFTPTHRGLIGRHPMGGHDLQIYLGYVMPLALAAGFLLMTGDLFRRRPRSGPEWILCFSLFAAVVAIVWLALGPRMPLDPHLIVFRAARRLFPPYRMIRQTAKIYAIMPPILSLLFGMILRRLARLPNRRVFGFLMAGGIALGSVYDYSRHIDPAVCLLDSEQGGYAAVVKDAAERERELRALALPLWPGDAHWSSLYEHYSSLYRIRMVNGYSPVVDRAYIADIFEPFYPFNIGYIAGKRLDDLLSRGIGYILLHEDAFPYKVSPFPVGQTLSALKQHPRLSLIGRDQSVWAFRVEESAGEPSGDGGVKPEAAGMGAADFYFPARIWFAAFAAPRDAEIVSDRPDVNRQHYLRVRPGGHSFVTPAQPLNSRPGLRYFARIKGTGGVRSIVHVEPHATGHATDGAAPGTVAGSSWDAPAEWEWIEVPVPEFSGYCDLRLELKAETGELDIDTVLLGAGHWPLMEIGQTLHLPAAAFFRSGYSIPETGRVIMERERVSGTSLFGPNHALPAGRYEIDLSFESSARKGVKLGRLGLGFPLGSEAIDVPVVAGHTCVFHYAHEYNLLFGLNLRFARNADLVVNALKITRLE